MLAYRSFDGQLPEVLETFDRHTGAERMRIDPQGVEGGMLVAEAGGDVSRVDLVKQFEPTREVFVRYYIRYAYGAPAAMQGVSIQHGQTPYPYAQSTLNDCQTLTQEILPESGMTKYTYQCGDGVVRVATMQERMVWSCKETHLDLEGPERSVTYWDDGVVTAYADQTCDDLADPLCELVQDDSPKSYDRVYFLNYVPSTVRSEVYLDQLVIANERVGCIP